MHRTWLLSCEGRAAHTHLVCDLLHQRIHMGSPERIAGLGGVAHELLFLCLCR
jgi:hypothetical protein